MEVFSNVQITDGFWSVGNSYLLTNFGQTNRDDHNKVYKSFLDIIESKKERFRETLLGKHINYLVHSNLEFLWFRRI